MGRWRDLLHRLPLGEAPTRPPDRLDDAATERALATTLPPDERVRWAGWVRIGRRGGDLWAAAACVTDGHLRWVHQEGTEGPGAVAMAGVGQLLVERRTHRVALPPTDVELWAQDLAPLLAALDRARSTTAVRRDTEPPG